jgi:hypothetical protein
MDIELYSMLPHSIGIQPYVSMDAYGNEVYGTLVAYMGRVQNTRRKVLNKDGVEVISDSTIFLATTDQIHMDAYITMPSGYLPTHPEIISIKRETDEFGAYSTTIYV